MINAARSSCDIANHIEIFNYETFTYSTKFLKNIKAFLLSLKYLIYITKIQHTVVPNTLSVAKPLIRYLMVLTTRLTLLTVGQQQ